MVKIHNSRTMLTTTVMGYCKLAALTFAMDKAKRLDPSATYVADLNTIFIHA